jgi:hypothetical protein
VGGSTHSSFYIGGIEMNSLRIENKDIYKIEVNDKGEYIEFDLGDIGLQVKCYEALEKMQQLEKETKEKEIELKKKADADKMEFVEANKLSTQLQNEMFEKARKIMDNFLGQGACQKIFGDRNYFEMFDDLFKELTRKRPELGGKSHFDKMGFKAQNINQRIMNKYKKGKKAVI